MSITAKATNPPAKWNPKKFPELAITHQLVLTGWGPNIRSAPTHNWEERRAGGVTQANWLELVYRIPQHYMGNPHYAVPDGEFALEFVPLDQYLEYHPGMCFIPYTIHRCLTAHIEYEGRHPCIVNHSGKVIHFAGEDKATLAGTAPAKLVKTKRMPLPATDSSASEEDSERDVNTMSPGHVSVGTASPSGPVKKRARISPMEPPVPREAERPMRPIPQRTTGEPSKLIQETKKRKRPVATTTQTSELWDPQVPGLDQNSAPDLFSQQDRGATPMFQPSFPPTPFGMQPPYGGQAAFTGPGYQAPFYPTGYGQQPWQQSNTMNGHQPWSGSQQYNPEEMEAFYAMRRGGYGNGPVY